MSPKPEGFLSSLDSDLHKAVEQLQTVARRLDLELYAVGGAVRDFLLDETVRDLDLVWVGAPEPGSVAEEFGRALDALVTYHPKFLTASLLGPGTARIDLSRARVENYSAPAALPSVRPALLNPDLARRDFSINAIALPLFGPAEWIDPCRGLPDVERRLLRILHDRSFEDDPTRILRGCELAVRRGLAFEGETRSRLDRALGSGVLERVSGTRIRHELVRLLGVPERAAAGADKLREFGVDRALHSKFSIEASGVERLDRLRSWNAFDDGGRERGTIPFFVVALAAISWDHAPEERRNLAEWLHLGRADREWLESAPERLKALIDGGRSEARLESSEAAMATLYKQLSMTDTRMAAFLAPRSQATRLGAIRFGLEQRLAISGADLLAAGIAPGPSVGKALEATLAARRSGVIDADGELAYALSWLEDHAV